MRRYFPPGKIRKLAPLWAALVSVVLVRAAHGDNLNLTNAEKTWLKQHPVLRMGVDPAFAPFEWVDEKSAHRGLAADYRDLLQRRLHVTLQPQTGLTWSQAIAAGKRGNIDLFSAIGETPARDKYLYFLPPYLHVGNVIVMRDSQGSVTTIDQLQETGKTVALVRDYWYTDRIRQSYPTLRTVVTPTGSSSLNLVASGGADATVAPLALVNYLIQQRGLTNLKIVGDDPKADLDLCFAVSRRQPVLRGIMAKAMASITPEEHDRIQKRWFNVQYTAGLDPQRVFRQARWIAGLVILVALCTVVWMMSMRREVERRRAAEAKFKAIFENMHGGYLLIGMDGKIQAANPGAARILGYDAPGDLVGMDMGSGIYADCEERAGLVQRLQSQGMVDNYELTFRRRDGSHVNVEYNVHYIRDASGQALGVEGIIRDITDERLAEAQLDQANLRIQQSQRQLQSIMDNSPAFIYLKDMRGRYIEINRQWVTACGFTDEQVLGHTDHELFPHHIAETFVEHDFRVLEEKTSMTLHETVPIGGEMRDFLSFKFPLFDPDGEILGIGGISTDITETKRSEAALRASEMRANAIIENMQGGYLKCGWDGIIQIANPGMGRILGCEHHLVLAGKHIGRDVFLDPSAWPGFLAILGECREIDNYELALRRQDGTVVFAECNAHLLTGPDGRPVGFEGLWRDVTAQREAREALERAREASDVANKAKSEFLANMSHEIRTPMNAILGLTHLSLQTSLDAQQRNYIEKIDLSARNLLGIVNDILDFSRVEAGKLSLESIEFDLEALLSQVASLFADRAVEKKLGFEYSIAPGLPTRLMGDPLRISQILTNFLANAFKFTEQGSVTAFIEPLAHESGLVHLKLSVTDTGLGLSASERGRLFQAFTQADGSTTRKHGGSGLGLTICKRLAEMMNGDVGVESERGRGSTFWATVSLGVPDPSSAGEHHDIVSNPELVRDPVPADDCLHGLRILLVEDNQINQEIARQILLMHGAGVVVANDGRAGLEALYRENFDAVLMDCQMPRMDGYEATRAIRSDPRFADLPIIAMTANVLKGDREKCLAAGMSDYIAKPIDLESLFATLSLWIDGLERPKLGASAPVTAMEIPGLDTATGIRRVGGDPRHYLGILRQFAENQRGAGSLIREAVRNGDIQAAIHMAHTLKGVARNLGALRLADVAEAAESELRAEKPEKLSFELQALYLELESFTHGLESYLDSVAPATGRSQATAPVRQAVDWASLEPCLHRTRQYLELGDTRAAASIQELKTLLAGTEHAREISRLEKAVAQYDFPAALELLPVIKPNQLDFT